MTGSIETYDGCVTFYWNVYLYAHAHMAVSVCKRYCLLLREGCETVPEAKTMWQPSNPFQQYCFVILMWLTPCFSLCLAPSLSLSLPLLSPQCFPLLRRSTARYVSVKHRNTGQMVPLVSLPSPCDPLLCLDPSENHSRSSPLSMFGVLVSDEGGGIISTAH